jgi:hypothetical protein
MRSILAVLAACMPMMEAQAQSEAVSITPWVQQAEYRRQNGGAWTFVLHIGLSYTNQDTSPVIVPLFGMVSGSRVEDATGHQVVRTEEVFTELAAVSLSIWAGSEPDPAHFAVLQPGQSFRSGARIEVLHVAHPGLKEHGLSPARQYLVYLQLDYDQRFRSEGASLPVERWSKTGRLITDRIETSPVRIQIPAGPPTRACPEPPRVTYRERESKDTR